MCFPLRPFTLSPFSLWEPDCQTLEGALSHYELKIMPLVAQTQQLLRVLPLRDIPSVKPWLPYHYGTPPLSNLGCWDIKTPQRSPLMPLTHKSEEN